MENSSFVHTFPKETMGYLCYFSVIHQAQLKARFPCVRCCFLCFRYGFFQKQGPQICKFSMGKIMGEMMEFDHFPQLVDPAAPCHVGMDWCHHNWSLVPSGACFICFAMSGGGGGEVVWRCLSLQRTAGGFLVASFIVFSMWKTCFFRP